MFQTILDGRSKWIDYEGNPILGPVFPEWLLGDPTVLPPSKTKDKKWHMYANSIDFINHFISDDGIHWKRVGHWLFRGFRPYLYVEDYKYYLLYEYHTSPFRSKLVIRESDDLYKWSDMRVLIKPEKGPDGIISRFTGNPCLIKDKNKYRLYFSSNFVWLWDCMYHEPKFVYVAEADNIYGPYKRRKEPMFYPDENNPYMNLGAGSVKVYKDNIAGFWVLNNGIYKDEKGRSRSAISIYYSPDGFHLDKIKRRVILAPDTEGWKKAFVYAFDLVEYEDQYRIYYNARDGWFIGIERIGMAYFNIKS